MQQKPNSNNVNPQLRPVDQSVRDIYEKPSICSQLPVLFDNGHVLERLPDGSCPLCSSQITLSELHGTISRPFSMVAIVEAVAPCHKCKVYVPFFLRCKDDGRIETRDAAGNWVFGGEPQLKGSPARELVVTLVFALVIVTALVILGVG